MLEYAEDESLGQKQQCDAGNREGERVEEDQQASTEESRWKHGQELATRASSVEMKSEAGEAATEQQAEESRQAEAGDRGEVVAGTSDDEGKEAQVAEWGDERVE